MAQGKVQALTFTAPTVVRSTVRRRRSLAFSPIQLSEAHRRGPRHPRQGAAAGPILQGGAEFHLLSAARGYFEGHHPCRATSRSATAQSPCRPQLHFYIKPFDGPSGWLARVASLQCVSRASQVLYRRVASSSTAFTFCCHTWTAVALPSLPSSS